MEQVPDAAAMEEEGEHSVGEGASYELEAGLADVANAAYRLRPLAAGWNLALNWTSPGFGVLPGADNVGIYIKGDRCALAFSGSNDIGDWIDDFTGSFSTMNNTDCGLVGIHEGIFQEWQEFVLEPEWNRDFVPFLDSDQCMGGISVVGHSLGGGVANLMAACQSNLAPGASVAVQDLVIRGQLRVNQAEVRFPVRQFSIYTVGTPAISRSPMLNGWAADGVFMGTRAYNSDRYSQDWAPTVGQLFGFYHPKMNALRLRDHWFRRGVEGIWHSGSADGTDLLPPETSPHGLPKVPSPLWHMCGQYVGRLARLGAPANEARAYNATADWLYHTPQEASLAQSLSTVIAEHRAEHYYGRKSSRDQ